MLSLRVLPVLCMMVVWASTPLALGAQVTSGQRASTPRVPESRRELVGVVTDPAGVAMQGANVAAQSGSTLTDARGAFRLFTPEIDTLTLTVRMVGFDPVSALLNARGGQWDTVLVQMERGVQRLADIKVKERSTRKALGLRDFDARRSQGLGIFLSRADLTEHQATRLGDTFGPFALRMPEFVSDTSTSFFNAVGARLRTPGETSVDSVRHRFTREPTLRPSRRPRCDGRRRARPSRTQRLDSCGGGPGRYVSSRRPGGGRRNDDAVLASASKPRRVSRAGSG